MLTRLILAVPGGRITGNRIEPCSKRTLTRQLKRTNLSPPPRRGFIDQVFRSRIQLNNSEAASHSARQSPDGP